MVWIHLAEDGDHCWLLINSLTNLWIPYEVGNFLTSWATVRLLASQEVLCVTGLMSVCARVPVIWSFVLWEPRRYLWQENDFGANHFQVFIDPTVKAKKVKLCCNLRTIRWLELSLSVCLPLSEDVSNASFRNYVCCKDVRWWMTSSDSSTECNTSLAEPF
jgi:hypothetical protein